MDNLGPLNQPKPLFNEQWSKQSRQAVWCRV